MKKGNIVIAQAHRWRATPQLPIALGVRGDIPLVFVDTPAKDRAIINDDHLLRWAGLPQYTLDRFGQPGFGVINGNDHTD
jgi:hypothetical protein